MKKFGAIAGGLIAFFVIFSALSGFIAGILASINNGGVEASGGIVTVVFVLSQLLKWGLSFYAANLIYKLILKRRNTKALTEPLEDAS